MKKIIVAAVFSLFGFLIVQNFMLRRTIVSSVKNISAGITELNNDVEDYQLFAGLRFDALEAGLQLLEDGRSKDTAEIQDRLASIRNRSEAQFIETVGMKHTYDEILDEQQKMTVDIAAQDSALEQIKKSAGQYYVQNNFPAAYREYKKVLLYQSDDMESRFKKMRSLYYMNPADSSKHQEILEDIRILKANGYMDEDMERIEMLILAEQGAAGE